MSIVRELRKRKITLLEQSKKLQEEIDLINLAIGWQINKEEEHVKRTGT